MKTKMLKESQFREAAKIICDGGLVAFRTETVYGLGADATDTTAVNKIFEAKGRPAVNPLIVHFASVKDIFNFFPDIDDATKKVLKKIKKALTVIINRGNKLSAIVSGGLDTVAVRVPSCRFARKFIRACGVPIAAPSANASTRPSPTTWQAVYEDLDEKIDAVIMGGSTKIGVESTVVKIENNKILVLRLGGCRTKRLCKKTGMPVEVVTEKSKTSASPGTRFKHYAPRGDFLLMKKQQNEKELEDFIKKKTEQGLKVAVLCFEPNKEKLTSTYPNVKVYSLGRTAVAVTKNFFQTVRTAEKSADLILCQQFEDVAEFEAINERILRASEGKIMKST